MARKPSTTGPVVDDVPGLRQRQRADGSWRVWWEPNATQRKTGATAVDLDASRPGHAAREARKLNDLAAARLAGKVPVTGAQARTVRALIADYRASRFFQDKAPQTRRAYGVDLAAIEDKWGPQPVTFFDAPICNTWYEALLAAKGAFRARAILRMFSILFRHAEVRGWRDANSNPVSTVSMKATAPRDRICSWGEFDALMDAAEALGRPMDALIVALGVYTGQRVTDILQARPEAFVQARMGRRQNARDGLVWVLAQNKTGKPVQVPIHIDLEPLLRDQLGRAAQGPGTLVWDQSTGKAYDLNSMTRAWARLRTEAAKALPGIVSLTQRDLRRTFSNNARAGGVTRDDLVDVMGNTLNSSAALAQVYTASQLATAVRAVDAVQKPKKERKQG